MKKIFPVLLLAFVFATAVFAENRTWTRASDGKAIKGEYVGLKDPKTVTIKMNGRNVDLPLAVLSEADQKFVADLTKPADSAPATPAKPKGKAAIPEGETTVTLSNVHVCCKECEEKVLDVLDDSKVVFNDKPSVKIEASRQDRSVKVTAGSGKDVQIALGGLLRHGYYGTSDHEALKMRDLKQDESYRKLKSSTLSVNHVNLHCRGRVKAAEKVIGSFDGLGHNIEGNPNAFVVKSKKGDNIIPVYDLMKALRDAGLGGSGM